MSRIAYVLVLTFLSLYTPRDVLVQALPWVKRVIWQHAKSNSAINPLLSVQGQNQVLGVIDFNTLPDTATLLRSEKLPQLIALPADSSALNFSETTQSKVKLNSLLPSSSGYRELKIEPELTGNLRDFYTNDYLPLRGFAFASVAIGEVRHANASCFPYQGVAPASTLAYIDLQALQELRAPVLDLKEKQTTFSVPNPIRFDTDVFPFVYESGARIFLRAWCARQSIDEQVITDESDAFSHSHPSVVVVSPAYNSHVSKNGISVGTTIADGEQLLTLSQTLNPRFFPIHLEPLVRVLLEKIGSPSSWNELVVSTNTPKQTESLISESRRISPLVVAPGLGVMAGAVSRMTGLQENPRCEDILFRLNTVVDVVFGSAASSSVVAGIMLLIRQFAINQGIHEPSNALLRATLVSCATIIRNETAIGFSSGNWTVFSINETDASAPTVEQGFGRPKLALLGMTHDITPLNSSKQHTNNSSNKAQLAYPRFHVLSRASLNATTENTVLEQGKMNQYSWCLYPFFSTNETHIDMQRVAVTLAWTDPKGDTQALQNNLDLVVTHNNITYYGNGNEQGDSINTIERVVLMRPQNYTKGTNIIIEVYARHMNSHYQNYSLVLTGPNLFEGNCSKVPLLLDAQIGVINHQKDESDENVNFTKFETIISAVIVWSAMIALLFALLVFARFIIRKVLNVCCCGCATSKSCEVLPTATATATPMAG